MSRIDAARRQGNYWQVGDVRNTAGRSMFLRLTGPASGKGAAGKWQDPSEGTHGDLLDVIRESLGLSDFADVLEEARRFLSLPQLEPVPNTPISKIAHAPSGSSEAARRLLSMSGPLKGSLAATYLRSRGITDLRDTGALKFHPNCYYRGQGEDQAETWPAMIAAVTDLNGKVTGVHRTWLARDGGSKAPVDTQRKAMGDLLGHAVRFGVAKEVMAAGEGIETVLSLRQALPKMSMVAALSAGHLAALLFPTHLRTLYIVRDNDPAGDGAECTSGAYPGTTRAGGRRPLPDAGPCDPPKRVISEVRLHHGHTAAVPSAGPRLGLLEGERPTNGPVRQWRRPTIFRRRQSRLCIARQNSRAWPSRPSQEARAARPDRLSAFRRHEGRDGRGPDDGASHVRQ